MHVCLMYIPTNGLRFPSDCVITTETPVVALRGIIVVNILMYVASQSFFDICTCVCFYVRVLLLLSLRLSQTFA